MSFEKSASERKFLFNGLKQQSIFPCKTVLQGKYFFHSTMKSIQIHSKFNKYALLLIWFVSYLRHSKYLSWFRSNFKALQWSADNLFAAIAITCPYFPKYWKKGIHWRKGNKFSQYIVHQMRMFGKNSCSLFDERRPYGNNLSSAKRSLLNYFNVGANYFSFMNSWNVSLVIFAAFSSRLSINKTQHFFLVIVAPRIKMEDCRRKHWFQNVTIV